MKIRPLADRVVIKKVEAEEKTASGIILPGSAKEHCNGRAKSGTCPAEIWQSDGYPTGSLRRPNHAGFHTASIYCRDLWSNQRGTRVYQISGIQISSGVMRMKKRTTYLIVAMSILMLLSACGKKKQDAKSMEQSIPAKIPINMLPE